MNSQELQASILPYYEQESSSNTVLPPADGESRSHEHINRQINKHIHQQTWKCMKDEHKYNQINMNAYIFHLSESLNSVYFIFSEFQTHKHK